jgi:phosphate transport system substrate-binding protein
MSRYLRNTVIAATVVLTAGAACAEPLIVQGSTTFSRRLLQPFQTDIQALTGQDITVVPNKSGPGLVALLEGRAQIIMLSAPLEAEIEHLKQEFPELHYEKLRTHEIDKARIALAVHETNPVRSITFKQISDVLLGRVDNWKSLGGNDLSIKIVLVGGGGGVTVAVQSIFLGGEEVLAPNKQYVRTPVQLVQVSEQEPGALGFAQFALTEQRGTKTLETEKPIEQVLYYVTLGEPSPAARALIDATRTVAHRAVSR